MSKEEWVRVEPTVVQKVGWRTIVTKTFTLPNGKTNTFDTISSEDSHDVGVIALTRDNLVVVVRLFRPGLEKVMIEIPGGAVDGGEDIKAAGMRELAEETGYVPTDDSEVMAFNPIPHDAYSNATKHYYLVTNVECIAEQKLDDEETIIVDTITIEDFIQNAKKGSMTDPGAVLLALDKLREIQGGIR
jgi:ADP-ribose pyrophosphatase